MNTAYYTFTTWNDGAMAAGFDGGASMVRQPPRKAAPAGDNVIDLNAWRAANLATPEEDQEERDWAGEDRGEEEELRLSPAPRPRRSRRAAFLAELASTLSVAAAALVLIVRVLAF